MIAYAFTVISRLNVVFVALKLHTVEIGMIKIPSSPKILQYDYSLLLGIYGQAPITFTFKNKLSG